MSGRLKHRVEVFSRVEAKTESGQRRYVYEGGKFVWCEIKPYSVNATLWSQTAVTPGGRNPYEVIPQMYRFVMRANALDVEMDMYFMYRGQRYDVMSAVPYFKDPSYQEVYTKLRIESDTRNGYKGSQWSGE